MTHWTAIRYRGFWDVPRIFVTRYGGHLVLFDCAFSESLDDYPDDYAVYLLPPELREESLPSDWTRLAGMAVRRLGTVPVSRVTFDVRHDQFDPSVLDELIAVPAPG